MDGTRRKFPYFTVLAALLLAVLLCHGTAFAETNEDIGALDGRGYGSLSSLASDLENNYEGKSVTIDMYRDWDAGYDHSEFNVRLYIPKDCTATLNMHGHVFNRNLVGDDEYDDDGELIYVQTGAKLTINGSSDDAEKATVHEGVRVFTDPEEEKAEHFITVQGGCLSGGNGDAGTGGIFIDSGKEVVLNDVTIAGCKASWWPTYTHTGYGGGIIITEDNTKLTLTNSRITGCLAEEDGGGIYAQDDDNISITLDNSSVDHNYAEDDCGGINMDGESVSITGKNGSSISDNVSEGYGGGVYFWNDDVSLTADKLGGLTIDGNRGEQGGGVYLDEENNTLRNLIITNNSANDIGGGVYTYNDYTTIDNCTITGNSKYGVYIDGDCDKGMHVNGATVIRDNPDGNLTLENSSAFMNFDRNDGLDIHIGYIDGPGSGESYRITSDICLDISDHFTADDGNCEVVYNYRDHKQDDGRRLFYIRRSDESDDTGHHRQDPEIMTISTQNVHAYTDPTRVYAGGYTEAEGGSGDQYELRTLYPHASSSGDKDFQLYYTDGFFFDDPVIYNDHLATASAGMASAGAYLDSYEYRYKHAGARQFMADIGCPDQKIYVNDSNASMPGTDTIGVTIASKVLQRYEGNSGQLVNTDNVLIAIAVRGANYEKEWTSNVTLGDGSAADGEAQGFSNAADQVMDAVDYYIHRYGLQEKVRQGKVKFWVSGFSRAGATSNLTSKRLVETYCYTSDGASPTGNEVFAYPVEAPKGGTDNAEKLADKSCYYVIHNLINTADLVPLVGPKEMGFKRYGVDHYMPGTHFGRTTRDEYLSRVTTSSMTPGRSSQESGVTSVTTYADNKPLSTKKNMDGSESSEYQEYATRRDNMVVHLATVNPGLLFSDYFYPWATKVDASFTWPPLGPRGDFDGAKLEDYLANLLGFLQQEACYNRDNYAVIPVHVDEDYNTIQELARAFFATGGTSDRKFKALMTAVQKIIDTWWNKAALYLVVGNYYDLSESERYVLIEYLWDFADGSGAFSDLTAAEYDVVHKYWFTIADTIFNFTDGDWDLGEDGQGEPVYPTGTAWINGSVGGNNTASVNMPGGSSANFDWPDGRMPYSLTAYKFLADSINYNHDRGVSIAWARTYDSYYSKDTSTGAMIDNTNMAYKANWVGDKNPDDYSVEKPKAYVTGGVPNGSSGDANAPGAYRELRETTSSQDTFYNVVDANQRIWLEVGQIHDDISPANVTQGDGDVMGEAIYYLLYDLTSGEENQLGMPQLYRGGVDLPVSERGGGRFKVVTYGKSLGQEGASSVYCFSVGHAVTVDDGSGAAPEVTYHASGESVTASAKPSDARFFTHWKVRLLDVQGNVVEDDITEAILGDKRSDTTVTFVVPQDGSEYAPGKHYPDGFALEVTAVCPYRIVGIELAPDPNAPSLVPVAANQPTANHLVGTANLSFISGDAGWDSPQNPYSVTWSYTYQDKTYPAAAGDVVYGHCVYTATIVAPKDESQSVVFASDLGAYASSELQDTYTEIAAVRDDADGSATYTIVFKETGGGPEPPAATNVLELKGVDLSGLHEGMKELGESGYVFQNQTIEVTAKSWEGYRFVGWTFTESYCDPYVEPVEGQDLSSKTIKLHIKTDIPDTHGLLCLYAQYEPVVTAMAADVKKPVGGQPMQMSPNDGSDAEALAAQAEQSADDGLATLRFKMNDAWYVVHPDYINRVQRWGSIAWEPQPLLATDSRKANYLTSYTANLRMTPNEEGEIEIKREGSDLYIEVSADLLYAEGLKATMNDDEAFVDTTSGTLSYTFPMTTYVLKKVYPPEDVTDVPYMTAGDDIRPYLPKVKILLDSGKAMTTTATWGDPHKAFDSLDEWSTHVWMASGVVDLPYGVENPDNISLDVVDKVFVNAADNVARAVPSVDPGPYLYDQRITLSCETEGAAVYWTVDPDATAEVRKVQEDPAWNLYEGQTIEINRADAYEDEVSPDGKPTGRKQIRLRAASFKDDMRPDGVRTYTYVFAIDVSVPDGHDRIYNGGPQIGVYDGQFYDLEPASEGVTIDEQGDAVATDPGTYQARAKIAPGFCWRITDPETGVPTYTTEDQIVTFTISGEKPGPAPGPTPGPTPGPAPIPQTGDDGGSPVWPALAGALLLITSLAIRMAHRREVDAE